MAFGISGLAARTLAVLGLSMALAACEGLGSMGSRTPDVTNAPAKGFADVKAGSEEDFILNVGRRTYFKSGSAEIDDVARTTLDKQAEWLKRYTTWKVKLQGFADDPGGAKANKALSAKRAEAVRLYLVSRGVEAARMWSKGYGTKRIVRDCSDITCKSQNRRVVTNLREEFDT